METLVSNIQPTTCFVGPGGGANWEQKQTLTESSWRETDPFSERVMGPRRGRHVKTFVRS